MPQGNHYGVSIPDVAITVYSGDDMAWEVVDCSGLEEWNGLEEAVNEAINDSCKSDHYESCCWNEDVEDPDSKGCDCGFRDSFPWEPSEKYYSDKPIINTDEGLDSPDATIVFCHNLECNTLQLLKSPLTGKRGLCSPCYPGQAESDTEGDTLCYRFPNFMLSKDKWVGTDREEEDAF